jgi:hypothetical protein
MRLSARILFAVFFSLVLVTFSFENVYAQTLTQPSAPAYQNSENGDNYMYDNTYSNVPVNHHYFTQEELYDVLSAVMCQLVGIDPTDPKQPCLAINPTNGKMGFAPTAPQQFGEAQSTQPEIGGAIGTLTNYITVLYVPVVNTGQYVQYLSANFGIVKPSYAAANTNCNTNQFGYGICGLSPIIALWADIRDLSYALLTVLFIAIGIGVMLRFRVDPRTVMTLQNQIPRVIIAIVLITFSFAISGAMIDLMWTATYAGVNFISSAAPNSQIALCPPGPKPMNQVLETRLIDDPISFVNTIFRSNCSGTFDNGFLGLADDVSASLGDLVQTIIHDLLFNDNNNTCHPSWWDLIPVVAVINAGECALQNGAINIIYWLIEIVVKLVIIICLLVALFRLWFQLIKCYVIFLIFVMMGPIWIVLGLIPGRPMGFEKWLRIIFSNLAVFPLVAFILVIARVLVDVVPNGPESPTTTFIPPLIGNANISTFSALMAFGAIMIAPTIPDLIKERMKASSQTKYGAAIAAGIGMGATAVSAPGRRVWENLNRRNPTTGAPEGSLAIRRAQIAPKIPLIGRRLETRERRRRTIAQGYSQGADIGQLASMRNQREAQRKKTPINIMVHNATGSTETTTTGSEGTERTTTRNPESRRRPFGRGGRGGRGSGQPPTAP